MDDIAHELELLHDLVEGFGRRVRCNDQDEVPDYRIAFLQAARAIPRRNWKFHW